MLLLIVAAFFIVSRIPKKPELGFSRQLFNPGEFRSTIPNVLDATISRSEKQVEVVVKRENVSLAFQLPLEGTKIKESENLLAFSSPNGTITTEYSMRRDGLKENIILNKIPQENTFPSTLKTEGLITKISAEGIPVFFDKNNTYQFHFERPYVKDAAGSVSYAVKYRVVGQKEENINKTQEKFKTELFSHLKTLNNVSQSYVLEVIVDPIWLHDPKRVLPITIDPTVVHNTSSTFATGTLDNSYDSGSGSSPILASGYQELATDPNTIGLWHMNEASGNVLDSSGNGNTGTPTNTSVVAGVRGNARSFNGTNSGIALASSTNANISGDITIEAWINPTSFTTTRTIVHKDSQYSMSIQVNTGYFAWADSSNWSYANFVYQNIGLKTGVWQHIAVTKSGGVVNVYLDGKLKITQNFGGSLTTTSNIMNIGCYSGVSACGSAYFDGSIDEVRISNTARSPEDIQAAASRRPYATYTSPVIDLGTKATSWSGLSWIENGVATGYGETPYSSTGLIAQWNMNDRGTATAVNYAGTCGVNCDATLTGFSNTNGPDLVNGSGWTAQNQRWGTGAIMFNGTTDYLSIPNHSSLNVGGGPFTIESWVKPKNLAMTTGCQTFDQTSSQTGWSGQNTETNTAYVSGMQASYTLATPLNYNSTYYWRSYAIDPNGTNVWTSTQGAPFSFTTLAVEAASSCKMTRTNTTTNTIEWVDVSANEAGYRIQRNVNNGGWVDLDASLNPNTVSYVDNTVQMNNSYQYRIASFIAGPQYSTWCTTQTQSINTGVLQFGGGFSFSGITIQ